MQDFKVTRGRRRNRNYVEHEARKLATESIDNRWEESRVKKGVGAVPAVCAVIAAQISTGPLT
jgi:hypothetical protein